MSPYNRAIQFGDAHFTTMKVCSGEIQLFSYHQARLQLASSRLGFVIDESEWQWLFEMLSSHAEGKQTAVVKIIISRGESQRGYAIPEPPDYQAFIYTSELPIDWLAQLQQGIALNIADFTLGHQPALAGLKHCNRLEQVMLKQELQAKGWSDAIVCDLTGNVIETSIANLFFYDGHTWYTPELSLAGVAGVYRQYILQQAKKHNIKIEVCAIARQNLTNFTAAFACNALQGIVPVTQIAENSLSVEPVHHFKRTFEN
ncbi:aminodeoxychorismate lyase [Saccharobesus litoralis]|uniref:aminodeoxychorismate lyase n=1 Tax=Saccharobesus litoralis TaxID=2172099 RepID=UPI00131EEE66|nr:aminodeoxychorismate lyase [Saccharobesus litoralis]